VLVLRSLLMIFFLLVAHPEWVRPTLFAAVMPSGL
jgi:hypothetical protein